MQDFTNLQSVRDEADKYIGVLFDKIESKGGKIDRSMYITPTEAYETTFLKASPWLSKYFGEKYDTVDKVVSKARAVAFDNDKTDLTDAMRGLANNLRRQRTIVRHVVRHSLLEDLSMVARFRRALSWSLACDGPVYNLERTDPVALAHYYSYLYKFSPLSQYDPNIWLANAKAYGELRAVTLTDDELDIVAEAVVAVQRALGIDQVVEMYEPNSLEATQIRALATNPTAAYSVPTMSNAKSKDARAEQLMLAKEYQADPLSHGNLPFVGQRRIQQGGNVLKEYMERLFPAFKAASEIPTIEQFDACMDLIAKERPSIIYYSNKKIVGDRFVKQRALPNSIEEREALVNNGEEEPAILLKFPDKTFRFNYRISEPNPWKLVGDDEASKTLTTPDNYDLMKSKNRVVFAGSNPVALNRQSFIHVLYDGVKEWTMKTGVPSFGASWKEPTLMRQVITNMVAAVNGSIDCHGKVVVVDDGDKAVIGSLSGDDKSAFDNFQAWILWAAFNCCIISIPFKKKYRYILRASSIETSMPILLTADGALVFAEAMPSGDGSTNLQDSFITYVGALFDISCRTGVRPLKIIEIQRKYDYGMLGQGDDYQGTDSADVDGKSKQDDFTKLGLNLSVPKSLISKTACEYTRNFTDGNYRYYEDSSSENVLALHAPLLHASVKINFGETDDSNSLAIEDVSNINRLDNLKYHPNFVEIAKLVVGYTKLALGTVPQWYVPEYNLVEWRKAGRPSGPSKFHVYINSPESLVKIASKEAEKKGSNLAAETDKSWMQMFDDTTKFNQMRTVKVLNAIMNKDMSLLAKYTSQVKYIPIYTPAKV